MTAYVIVSSVTYPQGQRALVEAIQSAYDLGAAGHFDTHPTTSDEIQVIFQRCLEDDLEYLEKRMLNAPSLSLAAAAIQQLAAELEEAEACEEIAAQVSNRSWIPFRDMLKALSPRLSANNEKTAQAFS